MRACSAVHNADLGFPSNRAGLLIDGLYSLTGWRLVLSGARLDTANLSHANLEGSGLSEASRIKCDVRGRIFAEQRSTGQPPVVPSTTQ